MTDNSDGKGNIRPAHYNRGGIEAIDVIHAWGLGFDLGNALKYIARAGYKPKGDDLEAGRVEDLRKARTYIDLELRRLAGDDDDTDPARPRPGLRRVPAPEPAPPVTEQNGKPPTSPVTPAADVVTEPEPLEEGEWRCSRCDGVKRAGERYNIGKPFEGPACALCSAQVRAVRLGQEAKAARAQDALKAAAAEEAP